MKHEPLTPWSEAANASGLDRQLGELFRAVPPADGLTQTRLEAVGRRLTRHEGQRSRRTARRGLLLAFAVLVGGGGTALAEWARPGWWRPLSAAPTVQRAAVTVPSARQQVTSKATSSRPSELVAAVPESARSSAPRSAPPPKQSSLALESESLKRVLGKLHRDRDPQGALALLDLHQAEFPRGELAIEAAAARVDALLLMRQNARALELLARFPLERSGRKNEFRLLRAELYAERDCRKALTDFDALLSGSLAPSLDERALYGRAACRLRLGDRVGGRSDLQRYLERYPGGRFAERVRAHLASP